MTSIKRFRLTDEELKKGVWISEIQILKTIKVCKDRNNTLMKKYIEAYEFLTGEKFDKKVLGEV